MYPVWHMLLGPSELLQCQLILTIFIFLFISGSRNFPSFHVKLGYGVTGSDAIYQNIKLKLLNKLE